MATTKFEYPASGSVTDDFLPSLDPVISGAGETRDLGIISEQSAGAASYRYAEGITRTFFRRTFRKMTATDKANFLTFLAAVQGDVFKFTDVDASEHTVYFSSFEFDFQHEEGARLTWAVELCEES
jgi:hypothetical protein